MPEESETKKTKARSTKTTPRKKKTTSAKRTASSRPSRKKKEQEIQCLRMKVMAYEHKLLDASTKQIIDTALRYDAKIHGPTPLPTEKKHYTVNRSTFVHKRSREQFEMRIHKRLVDIENPSGAVIDALTNLTLPSGVEIDVKML